MNILKKARLLTGPWILYDGTCHICRTGAARWAKLLHRRGFRLDTLQSPTAQLLLPPNFEADDEMKLVLRDGTILGGAEAFITIAQHIWWTKPIAWLWHFPPIQRWMQRKYRHIADHRHCSRGQCAIASENLQRRDRKGASVQEKLGDRINSGTRSPHRVAANATSGPLIAQSSAYQETPHDNRAA